MEIENFINNFIEQTNEKFSFDDIKKVLQKDLDIPERIIIDLLEESPLLFTIKEKSNTLYLPKKNFLKISDF